jgi:hypothetical protein
MSRIYVVAHARTAAPVRFVRATSKNAAVRAVAEDLFEVKLASADDIVSASQSGTLDILDALVQADDGADPGPVPADATTAVADSYAAARSDAASCAYATGIMARIARRAP